MKSSFTFLRLFFSITTAAFVTACSPTQISDNFYAGIDISPTNSTVEVTSATVLSGGTVTVSVSLKDTHFNPFISTLPVVSFAFSGGTSTGVFGPITNRHDGTYSATFTAFTAGTASAVHAIVDGVEIQSALPTIQVISGTVSSSFSTIALSASSVVSGSSITATLTTRDSTNTPITAGGYTIVFSNSGGVSTGNWSATTDNHDGTYSATFTGVLAGSATTVGATVQGSAITSTLPTVSVSAGTASQIKFTTQPSSTGDADTDLTQQPVISAEDAAGNVDTSDTHTVTLAAYSDTACSTAVASGLTATTNPVTASSGVATFAGVRILKTNVIRIGATSNGHTVCSSALAISPGALGALTFTTAPTSPTTNSAGHTVVVTEYDSHSNLLAGDSTTSLSLTAYSSIDCSTGTVGSSLSPSSATASSGVATFTSLVISDPSVQSIKVSSGGVSACAGSLTVYPPAPAAPTSLSATAGTANVSLSWTASTGAASYTVYRSTSSGSSYSALTACTAQTGTTCTDLTALNGTQYYYVVRASNAGGASGDSSEVTAEPLNTFSLTALAVNDTAGPSALQISWPAVTGAASYTVKYGTTTAYGSTVTSATSPTTITGLTAGTTYHVTVTASNAVGSGVSHDASSELTGIPMTRPTISSVTQPASSQAKVTFTSGTGATSHTIASGTSTGVYGTATTGTSPYTISSLTDGTQYYFMVNAVNTSGSLSAGTEGNLTLITDTVAPNNDATFTLARPTASKSAYSTADLSGNLATETAATTFGTNLTLKFYLNDNTCASGNLVGTVSGAPGASYTVTTSSLTAGGDGLKTLYYTIADASGHTRACATSGLSYTYQATPIVSFTNLGATIKEDGTVIGTALSISRDECGAASTVNVATADVSAIAGTDYTSTTPAVTFSATDCSPKAVPFTIITNSAVTGDLFFKASITSLTGAAAAKTNQIAQVNIVDANYTGDFMFNQPLYSVSENGTNASLTVQRTGATTGTASVDVVFVDGSAVNNTDYTGTTQTVTFSAGTSEVTINVPIADNSTKGDNKSFIAKLQNPSTGTALRNLSVAKVRILNDDGDNATCSTADTPYGNSNLGTTGNGTTVPYTICSLAQLKQVASNPTKKFRMMADIVNDGTLAPITSFSGVFDGNEEILYNFSYSTSTVVNAGLFADPQGSGSAISNFNLMHAVVSNTKASSNSGLLIGSTSGWPIALNNILVHGYLSVTKTGDRVGLVAGFYEVTPASVTTSANKMLTYGRVINTNTTSGTQVWTGGMIGYAFANGTTLPLTISYSDLYNTATANSGGIMGNNQFAGTIGFDRIENRGLIITTESGTGCGGIIGLDNPLGTSTETFNHLANYGIISCRNTAGGFLGNASPNISTSISNSTNYAKVSTTSTTGNAGGAVGLFSYGTLNAAALNFSSVHNVAAVSATAGSSVGGILGNSGSNGDKGITLSIDNCDNSGDITAKDTVGGIAGNLGWSSSGAAPTNNSVSITNSSNTGNISATTGAIGNAGGIVGSYFGTIAADSPMTMTNLSSTVGAITCSTGIYCGGIIGAASLEGSKVSNFSNLTVSSSISGKGSVGGIIGSYDMSGGPATTSALNISNAYVTSAITSATGAFAGGMIGQFVNTYGTFTMTHSSFTGTMTATGTASYTGGLIGQMKVGGSQGNLITTTFVNAPVNGPKYTGGLFGVLNYTTGVDSVSLTDVYASGGVVSAGQAAGGIIGYLFNSGTTSRFYGTHVISLNSVTGAGFQFGGFYGNSDTGVIYSNVGNYWIKDTGINASFSTSDGNNRTAAQLQSAATYGGLTPAWVFDSTTGPWNNFVPGAYPTLK